MKNKIYSYFLSEFLSIFIVILLTLTFIAWVVQAVNYLEFVTEDGHSFGVYFLYSILSFPKISAKLLPFVYFVSLFTILLTSKQYNEELVEVDMDLKVESSITSIIQEIHIMILNLICIEIEKKLQKAILTLPTKQRLVFNMRYYEEIKYEEMALILDTSVGALKASYHHAKNKIEDYLKTN